jgi:hypothetical protein
MLLRYYIMLLLYLRIQKANIFGEKKNKCIIKILFLAVSRSFRTHD